MRNITGAKTTAAYIQRMRSGQKNVSQVAMMYAHHKRLSHNQGDPEISNKRLIDLLKERLN